MPDEQDLISEAMVDAALNEWHTTEDWRAEYESEDVEPMESGMRATIEAAIAADPERARIAVERIAAEQTTKE